MNCIPLLPVANTRFALTSSPSAQLMHSIRAEAGEVIPQMRHCTRCRADALGLLGEDGQLEDICGAQPQVQAQEQRKAHEYDQ